MCFVSVHLFTFGTNSSWLEGLNFCTNIVLLSSFLPPRRALEASRLSICFGGMFALFGTGTPGFGPLGTGGFRDCTDVVARSSLDTWVPFFLFLVAWFQHYELFLEDTSQRRLTATVIYF